MHSRTGLSGAVVWPLGVSVCAAGVALAMRALLRKRMRPAVLLNCERKAHEILEVLAVAAVGTSETCQWRTAGDDVACVVICVSWNGERPLRVPTVALDSETFCLSSVFSVYCGLMRYVHPDCFLVCDVWNCLVALVEHRMRRILMEDGITQCVINEEEAGELVTLCSLLRGKYSVRRSLHDCCREVVVREFPEVLFERLTAAYNSRNSLRSGVVSFVKLACSSCSTLQLLALVTVVVLSPELVLRCVMGVRQFVNWRPIYAAEIGKALSAGTPSRVPLLQFFCEQLRGAPGRLAAVAVASTTLSEMFYSFRSDALQFVLSDIIFTFRVNAYLALATADYDPSASCDDNWPIARCVSQALWQASTSVLDELRGRAPAMLEVLHGVRVVFKFPAVSLAAWSGAQWSNFVCFLSESLYMESQFAKGQFASVTGTTTTVSGRESTLAEHNSPVRFPSPSASSSPSPLTLLRRVRAGGAGSAASSPDYDQLFRSALRPQCGDAPAAQHGLLLFLVVCVESVDSPSYTWELLTQHVTWPAVSCTFTKCVADALTQRLVSHSARSVGIQRLGWMTEVVQRTRGEEDITLHTCSRAHRRDYLQAFALLRLSGLELTAAAAATDFVASSTRADVYERCRSDVLHGIFQVSDALPLLLLIVVASRVSPNFFEQSVLEQTEVVNQLRSIQHWCPLFQAFIGCFYDEDGMSEVEIDAARMRRRLASDGSSLGCYQVLEKLQSMEPQIDRPIKEAPAPLEGPWSVEFRDVSFRYSSGHPYVLRRVSFSVGKGQFLGIAGYSGSGKTTILRLLNRTYAPTEGEIFVNGLPITEYPARALRRGVANVWQEEGRLKLFDGHSIEGNVALGNLSAASNENIAAALAASQALSFVERRSSGVRAPLSIREFSGGEVDRLCLARAFMKAGSTVGLCMFDEPTSALDAVTEGELYDTLRGADGVLRGVTVIIVAHRLSTLRCADNIIVLKDGTVAESGSWQRLSAAGPDTCFGSMYKSQQLPDFLD